MYTAVMSREYIVFSSFFQWHHPGALSQRLEGPWMLCDRCPVILRASLGQDRETVKPNLETAKLKEMHEVVL